MNSHQITTLETLTYDTGSSKNQPSILVPPRYWNFSSCRQQLTDEILLYNPTPIELDIDRVDISAVGAQTDIGPHTAKIQPYSFITVPVTANRTAPLGAGTIDVTYSYTAVNDDFTTFAFNPSSITSPYLLAGVPFTQTYAIKPVVFDRNKEYRVELWSSGWLAWVSASTGGSAPGVWNENTEIPVELVVNPPQGLAEGIYTDTVNIAIVHQDNYVSKGKLNVEITKTAFGTQVHTSYELGEIPYVRKQGDDHGVIVLRDVSCEGGGGDGDGPPIWHWIGIGPIVTGTIRTTTPGTPPFPQYIAPPVAYSDHQQVRLQISQQIMLEGEGFNAALRLDNTSTRPIDVISVDVRLTDFDGVDRTSGFMILPRIPTDLGSVPVGDNTTNTWLIVPSELGEISPQGNNFEVVAIISYWWNGAQYIVHSLPETITVYPAPKLKILYQLPSPNCRSTLFDIKTTIENVGMGAARKLRFSSAQPVIVDNQSNLQIGFQIIEAFVDGQPRDSSLALDLGDLSPNGKVEVVWRLQSTLVGSLVEFTSDYRQRNYLDAPLNPLIEEIRTEFLPGQGDSTTCTAISNSREKPPLLLVHGIQTLDFGGQGFACQDDLVEFNGYNSTLSNDLPRWLVENYNVWIAHLDSTPIRLTDTPPYFELGSTPRLAANAECLAKQVDKLFDTIGHRRITIVAHSMGGIVSRACISQEGGCKGKVRALYIGLLTNELHKHAR